MSGVVIKDNLSMASWAPNSLALMTIPTHPMRRSHSPPKSTPLIDLVGLKLPAVEGLIRLHSSTMMTEENTKTPLLLISWKYD
jgi:hypothetical protein